MARYTKRDFNVDDVRKFLEPGPIVLVSSAYKGEQNIMTMGWHTCMGFEPSLIGCYIWDQNYSQQLIKRSKECVINIPEVQLLDTVVKIGNSNGDEIDKFETFGLTAVPATKVKAPLIEECFANFECKLYDSRLIKEYNFFIWEVVKAHVATRPKYPKTFHYTGDGVFMLSGNHVSRKRLFKPEYLG
jgi:flavin reductase (DIM6/NTAB) family NADH-FMN oxidoreductase RutF